MQSMRCNLKIVTDYIVLQIKHFNSIGPTRSDSNYPHHQHVFGFGLADYI